MANALLTEKELLDIVDGLIRDAAYNRPAAVSIGMAVGAAVEAEVRERMEAQKQSREGTAEDLYGRLESLSKAMESSGRIDEHEHPDAYGAILDAMKYVQADLNAPETQPGAPGFDGADAWNAYGA